jgi:hypothetical protein
MLDMPSSEQADSAAKTQKKNATKNPNIKNTSLPRC